LERHSQEEMDAANTEYSESNNKSNHITKKPPVTFFHFYLKHGVHFFVSEFVAEREVQLFRNLITCEAVIPY